MENDDQQLINERLNALPKELMDFIVSPELPRKINLIAKKYNLNDDQEISLKNEILLTLLVLESIEDLPKNLEEGVGVTPEASVAISQDVFDYILRGVDEYLAHTQADLVIEEPSNQDSPTPIQTPITDSEHPEHPSKERILQEIETPSKTYIKRYKIEYDHNPLNDTSHLISDKVDNVVKIEAKYND